MAVIAESDLAAWIKQDEWMMAVLREARSLQLPDWWICAGFIRSKIWDVLSGFPERTPPADIDVIYFDKSDISEKTEKGLEAKLRSLAPGIPWSVKNEARMHLANHMLPYKSSADAISKFPETATALGVKLERDNRIVLAAPHGIDDAVHFLIRPTPYFLQTQERKAVYEQRIQKKQWQKRWIRLSIYHF